MSMPASIPVHVEIMVPLVGNHKELRYQKNIIDRTADEVFAERNDKIDYMVGTMIEVPRAAVTANQIAEVAEFFSFGTNDLTQDDAAASRATTSGKFLGGLSTTRGVYEERSPRRASTGTAWGKLVARAADAQRSQGTARTSSWS